MSDPRKSIFKRVTTELPGAPVQAHAPAEPPWTAPPQSPRPQHRYLPVVVAAVLLVLLVLCVELGRRRNVETLSGEQIRTATVERREFLRTLRLSGRVEAIQSRAITVPQIAGSQVGSMVVTRLAAPGSRVKRADLLAEFDRQSQVKMFLDKQAEYRGLVAQIAQKQAGEASARAKDETDVKQAEDALAKAELDVLKNEILSRIGAEKNQEALEEAKANLKQLRATFELKRQAAQADIKILEIQHDRAREIMQHAQQNEEKMIIRSPMDGIVVLNSIWKGGKMGEVQEGDEVHPWGSFMRVVDTSAMQVRAQVNQVDLVDVHVGQPARIHLDAYPELVFPGKLEQLAPMAVHSELSDKVYTFAAIFFIQGSDPKLMPDLSAAVDAELKRVPNALVVPRDSLMMENGKTYVQVKNGGGWEKRPLKLGPMSDIDAVVESGLDAGAVVLRN